MRTRPSVIEQAMLYDRAKADIIRAKAAEPRATYPGTAEMQRRLIETHVAYERARRTQRGEASEG